MNSKQDKAERAKTQEKSNTGSASATLSTVSLLPNTYTTCIISMFNVH